MTTSEPPSILLVGITGYGSLYLNELEKLHLEGEIRLTDAVVINQEDAKAQVNLRRLEKLDTRIHASWDERMLRREPPDLICLPVGIPAHRELCEQALDLGASVLLEKPAAGSVADWKAMCRKERESSGFVAVGFQHIHSRPLREVKRRLLTGEWGDLQGLVIQGCWPRDDSYYTRNQWAGKRTHRGIAVMDSPFQNAFAHYPNLGLFLAGPTFREWARTSSVQGHLYRAREELETFDTCSVRFQLESGVPMDVHLTHACGEIRHPVVELRCENGRIRIEPESVTFSDGEGSVSEPISRSPHPYMFRDAVARLRDPDVFLCTLEDAGAHLQAMECLMRELTIEELDPALRDRDGETGQVLIPGIEGLIQAAAASGDLLSLVPVGIPPVA